MLISLFYTNDKMCHMCRILQLVYMTSLNELDNDNIRLCIWNTYDSRDPISSTAQIEDITACERSSSTEPVIPYQCLKFRANSDNMWNNVSIKKYYDDILKVWKDMKGEVDLDQYLLRSNFRSVINRLADPCLWFFIWLISRSMI